MNPLRTWTVSRRRVRVAASAAVMLSVAALAGCASRPAYDDVLWLQMRDQQTAVMDLRRIAPRPLTHDVLLATLAEAAVMWDPAQRAPSFPPSEPASVVYDVEDAGLDEFGYPTMTFTEFVSSGTRPDVPRRDTGTQTGEYHGPSAVYTCYRWRVVFVAERVWEMGPVGYADGEDIGCPDRLIERLPDDAEHIATADLVG